VKKKEIIKINNLSFKYPNSENLVLNNISINIYENDFICLLGKNGSGKTTLAKLISGNLIQSENNILVYNKLIKEYSKKDLSKIISYLPQNLPENIPFSVIKIILMGRYPYKNIFENYNLDDISISKKYLKLLDLEILENKNFDDLSGGEKRRVLLAQTLVSESNIIILDEPEAFIDIPHKISLYESLKYFNEKLNKTIIVISHDLNLALKYSKRLIFLSNNKVYFDISEKDKIDKNIIKTIFDIDVNILKINNNPYIIY